MMGQMFLRHLKKVWLGQQTAKPQMKATPPRAKLKLERLEDRELLATWLWVGENWSSWGNQNNWRETTTEQKGVPAATDSVVFDPTMTKDGQPGANTVSLYDRGALSLANLTFHLNSTARLHFDTSADDLTITGSVNMAGGTTEGAGDVKLADYATFAWTGGNIDNTWWLGNDQETNVTTTISGTGTKTILPLGRILNSGTITWTDTGTISHLGYIIQNDVNGTIDIRGNAAMSGGGYVTNYGTFKKTAGGGTTTIQPEFRNYDTGQFLLQSGVVKFTGAAMQNGDEALTQLNGGNLETTTTYYVAGSLLEGVGTITGNLSTDHPAFPGDGWGTIKPGLGSEPGTLNVFGDFTMTEGATLVIRINASGGIGKVSVQQDAQGQRGNANLAGTLTVHRDPSYTPPPGTALTFLTYAAAAGDFEANNFSPYASWYLPPFGLLHFAPKKQATAYKLVVEAW